MLTNQILLVNGTAKKNFDFLFLYSNYHVTMPIKYFLLDVLQANSAGRHTTNDEDIGIYYPLEQPYYLSNNRSTTRSTLLPYVLHRDNQ